MAICNSIYNLLKRGYLLRFYTSDSGQMVQLRTNAGMLIREELIDDKDKKSVDSILMKMMEGENSK